jgi:hypothetical protein
VRIGRPTACGGGGGGVGGIGGGSSGTTTGSGGPRLVALERMLLEGLDLDLLVRVLARLLHEDLVPDLVLCVLLEGGRVLRGCLAPDPVVTSSLSEGRTLLEVIVPDPADRKGGWPS